MDGWISPANSSAKIHLASINVVTPCWLSELDFHHSQPAKLANSLVFLPSIRSPPSFSATLFGFWKWLLCQTDQSDKAAATAMGHGQGLGVEFLAPWLKPFFAVLDGKLSQLWGIAQKRSVAFEGWCHNGSFTVLCPLELFNRKGCFGAILFLSILHLLNHRKLRVVFFQVQSWMDLKILHVHILHSTLSASVIKIDK